LKIAPIPEVHHLLLRLHAGDVLPDTLLAELRKRQITGGSLRLSGVVKDVELSAFSAELEGPGGTKHIAGPIQAVVLEGNLGVADGDVCADLRVVLARETDRGLETIAGQLRRARVVGLEGSVTLFDETVVPRAKDKAAGIRLLRDDAVVSAATLPRADVDRASAPAPPPARASVPAAAPSAPVVPPSPGSWSDAVAASAPSHPARPPATLTRPPRRVEESEDGPYPVAGDTAEHFAFGSCEVLKSDGDRLHLRMKDGRIREIALEMLKVTPLGAETPDGGNSEKKRYRLDRRV
jgi:predicted DNA-binding protein with PD1-like motif